MGGTKPWPEVPVGNKDHTNATVVIIGAGISGKSNVTSLASLLYLQLQWLSLRKLQACAPQST